MFTLATLNLSPEFLSGVLSSIHGCVMYMYDVYDCELLMTSIPVDNFFGFLQVFSQPHFRMTRDNLHVGITDLFERRYSSAVVTLPPTVLRVMRRTVVVPPTALCLTTRIFSLLQFAESFNSMFIPANHIFVLTAPPRMCPSSCDRVSLGLSTTRV